MTEAPYRSGSTADALLSALTRCLAAVGVLALTFTAVNVTLFATAHGVPWPIALLLDPMVALPLATVLYADARLTGWGLHPPAWSAALRWFAGITATLMNTWTALWPDGRIGRPAHADPAAVLLHAVPPLLLILLTETVAAYRRLLQTSPVRTTDGSATALAPSGPCHHATPPGEQESAARSATALPADADPDGFTGRTPHPEPAPQEPRRNPAPARRGRLSANSRPDTTPTAPSGPSAPAGDAGGDLFIQALRLDQASRTLTGRPVSQRRLRTELHLGPERAREIHHLLHDHHTARPAL